MLVNTLFHVAQSTPENSKSAKGPFWASATSRHGPVKGLGLLRGRVERFPETAPDGSKLRVPHIGWNDVRFQGSHPMLEALPEEDQFYFVHSYRVVPKEGGVTVGVTDYGGAFPAAVATERMFAVQFHPEKSQGAGKRLLDAYVAWVAACR